MSYLILEPRNLVNLKAAYASIIIGSIVIIGAFYPVVGTSMFMIYTIVSVLILLSAAGFIVFLHYYLSSKRARLEALRKMIAELSYGEARFARPLMVQPVYVYSAGVWVTVGRSRRYSSKVWFEPAGDVVQTDRVSLRDLTSRGFHYAVYGSGDGYVAAPGILVKEPGYTDSLILLLPSHIEYEKREHQLTLLGEEGDHAEARVTVEEGVLKTRLSLYKKVKARSARVEIEWLYTNLPGFFKTFKIYEILAATKEQGTVEAVRSIGFDRSYALLLPKLGDAKPLTIVRLLRKAYGRPRGLPRIAGFGMGEPTVKLVLDYRLRKDKITKQQLIIRPASPTQ